MKSKEVSKLLTTRTRLPLNLQLFAETGDGDGGEGNEGENEGDDEGDNDGDDELSITPEMQAIIDSVVGKEKAKLKAKYKKEIAESEDRAKRLAGLSERERAAEEEKDRIRKLEEREKKVAEQEYRLEAQKQLSIAKLSADFADVVLAADPETTAVNIKTLRAQIDAEVETEVKKRLAGTPPASGSTGGTVSRGEQIAKAANEQTTPSAKDPWA